MTWSGSVSRLNRKSHDGIRQGVSILICEVGSVFTRSTAYSSHGFNMTEGSTSGACSGSIFVELCSNYILKHIEYIWETHLH
jgi:hypothetical protein